MVGVTGFEPTASWSRTKRATICATPREKNRSNFAAAVLVVGDERIELPRAESESAALPLCESPVGCLGFLSGCPWAACPRRLFIIAARSLFVNSFFKKIPLFFQGGKFPFSLHTKKNKKACFIRIFLCTTNAGALTKGAFVAYSLHERKIAAAGHGGVRRSNGRVIL